MKPPPAPRMGECEDVLAAAVARLRQLVTALGSDECVEMELRFGHLQGASSTHGASGAYSFVSNMHRLYFADVVTALEACTQWSATTQWQQTTDVYYTLPDGRQVRTVVASAPSPSAPGPGAPSAPQDLSAVHVVKTRQLSHFLPCASQSPVSSQSGMDLRVTVNTEEPVPEGVLPAQVNPTWVRIKQRRSFTFRHWRWDVSRVWQGRSRMEVDAAQRNDQTWYEVELELVNAAPYLAQNSDSYVAQSCIRKVWDLAYRVARDDDLRYLPLLPRASAAPTQQAQQMPLPPNVRQDQPIVVTVLDGSAQGLAWVLLALLRDWMVVPLLQDGRKLACLQDFVDHCTTASGQSLPEVQPITARLSAIVEGMNGYGMCVVEQANSGLPQPDLPGALVILRDASDNSNSAYAGRVFHMEEETALQYIWPCDCDDHDPSDVNLITDLAMICGACALCAPVVAAYRAVFQPSACSKRCGAPLQSEQ